ncbi:hypothetical protein QVD17_20123 [Tagetes erecta]|uniref:pyruvate decarboxylase n=1 Tax=Tagetes erecta TaxID=13708 RepID=A0AAD8NQR4_TARER|nr:hypothetical protein QVD17_20123 [Tagetes erecta]
MEANNAIGSTPQPITPISSSSSFGTLGSHLARRLVQIGVQDVFSVPGDFNLTLLDHLIAEPGLNLVGCCNELNAGYAADGYARAKGVGACVVTFTVGGLSVLNAIAGAYSESLPVICIVGGPNSNDYGTNRILHHTIGLPDFSQELQCFRTVTCAQVMSIGEILPHSPRPCKSISFWAVLLFLPHVVGRLPPPTTLYNFIILISLPPSIHSRLFIQFMRIIVHEIGREQSCILLESLASKSNFIASNPRMLTSVMINAIYLQATMEGIGIPSRVRHISDV